LDAPVTTATFPESLLILIPYRMMIRQLGKYRTKKREATRNLFGSHPVTSIFR
jgi:hypothetical protein